MRNKKKLWKRCLALGLAVLMGMSATACSDTSKKGTVTVDFMYVGDLYRIEAYKILVDAFNESYGPSVGVKVKGIPKSGSDGGSVYAQQLPSKNGADVYVVSDNDFKKYARYLDDLTGKLDPEVLDGVYNSALYRCHYDMHTTTSNEEDPLLAMPVYGDAVMLFYNRTALEAVGVTCISVREENLDAFNAGTLADNYGKTKADYGIDFDVPAKGFYRSMTPFVPAEGEKNGASWKRPAAGEKMVFNDAIAMNWDEVEDLGLICTKDRNPSSATQYGYYTEWWFNYGWSVGGNCLEDLSGSGDWTYALAGENPNYIVQDDKTYTGIYTGTKYEAGETLDLKDVVNAQPGDTIAYDTDNASYFHYTVNGKLAEYRDFSKEIGDGTLKELPATKDAFQRFCMLAGVGGLNVCPTPETFANSGSLAYFTSGNLALQVNQLYYMPTINKTMTDEWGVAPIPQYKVYTDPSDPSCDTAAVKGATGSFSFGNMLVVSDKSGVKDAAYVFLNWMASEGQRVLAENGHPSVREADREVMREHFMVKNSDAVLDCLKEAQAGDWWYMPDSMWIEIWATPLNYQVRYGKMRFEDFLYSYTDETNDYLKLYKQ